MSVLGWLRGGDRRPSDFELALIEAVAGIVPAGDAERIRRRVSAINLVQRHGGGQEVIFYQLRRGKPVFPADTAVLDAPRSIDYALIETRSDEPTSRLRATLGLHRGNVASLEFNRPSKFAQLESVNEMRAHLLGPPFVDPDEAEDAMGGWPAPPR